MTCNSRHRPCQCWNACMATHTCARRDSRSVQIVWFDVYILFYLTSWGWRVWLWEHDIRVYNPAFDKRRVGLSLQTYPIDPVRLWPFSTFPMFCICTALLYTWVRKWLKVRPPETGQRTSGGKGLCLCVGNSPVTGEFPAQMTSNVENVSIWWRHHEHFAYIPGHLSKYVCQSWML